MCHRSWYEHVSKLCAFQILQLIQSQHATREARIMRHADHDTHVALLNHCILRQLRRTQNDVATLNRDQIDAKSRPQIHERLACLSRWKQRGAETIRWKIEFVELREKTEEPQAFVALGGNVLQDAGPDALD